MRYYDTLAEYEREGYTIIVDKSWEDLSVHDCFDISCHDTDQICKDIDNGNLDWFMLRVRVMVEGLEIGSHYLGGCLYKDAKDVLTDGTAEDCIGEALHEAKSQVYRLSRVFGGLSEAVDREGVLAV
jgi:hypothetical protein